MDAVHRLNGCYVIIFTNDIIGPLVVMTGDKLQQHTQQKSALSVQSMHAVFQNVFTVCCQPVKQALPQRVCTVIYLTFRLFNETLPTE